MLANAVHWVLLLSALTIASFLGIKHHSPVAQMVKNLRIVRETQVQSLSLEDPLEKKMQHTPIFLPGTFHGHRSLAGYSPWGSKEPDTTEQLTHTQTHTHTHPSLTFAMISLGFHWGSFLTHIFPPLIRCLALTIWCAHKARTIIRITRTSLWSIPGRYWKIWWVKNYRNPPAFT